MEKNTLNKSFGIGIMKCGKPLLYFFQIFHFINHFISLHELSIEEFVKNSFPVIVSNEIRVYERELSYE